MSFENFESNRYCLVSSKTVAVLLLKKVIRE